MSSTVATPDTTGRPVDGRAITPDGVEIAYRLYPCNGGGSGAAVLLLPGIGGNLEALDEIAQGLTDRYRVVSVEPRGIGQSGESETISTPDMVTDVESVVAALGLSGHAVVGASLGGLVAGEYGARHPGVPVVSLDGFAGGVASVGSAEDQLRLRRFMDWARISLRSMTAAPEEGDDDWKQRQIRRVTAELDAMGYRAAHREAMVERNFVALPDGRWRRHPSSKIVDAADREGYGVEPPGVVTRTFRRCAGPVLIVACTRTEWPGVFDAELDDLTETHPNVTVQRLDLTHTGPVTDGVEPTVAVLTNFLAQHLP
jgi:pimeloyl-ACP methyl ester carboxylesterase